MKQQESKTNHVITMIYFLSVNSRRRRKKATKKDDAIQCKK
jgi:hypothetical protein